MIFFALPQWGSKIGHQNPKNEENLQHQKLLQPIQTKLRKHGKGEETSEKEDDKVACTPSMRTYKETRRKREYIIIKHSTAATNPNLNTNHRTRRRR